MAETMRTDTWMSFTPPTRLNVMRSSTRSSLTCSWTGISPISSRNSVPPLASSSSPCFCARASVKAPFSWPNSSLSSRSFGMAAQLTSTNGLLARSDCWWMRRAIISLPVPDSPSTRTLVVSPVATMPTCSYRRRIAGETHST